MLVSHLNLWYSVHVRIASYMYKLRKVDACRVLFIRLLYFNLNSGAFRDMVISSCGGCFNFMQVQSGNAFEVNTSQIQLDIK